MNDFSSIDRLIEFGLSIAVAQQMMNTVNTCIHQMTIPGRSTRNFPRYPSPHPTWYYQSTRKHPVKEDLPDP